jgi:methyltransferase
VTAAIPVLAFVTCQRLAELLWARRNTVRLLARGAVEHGAGHYGVMISLHALWLGGLWILAWDRTPQPFWLLVFAGLQVLRVWILVTLGPRWTTRVIVSPGAALVTTGPYRFLTHPNYAVVAAEIAVLPLAFGLYRYALLFSVLNAGVLAVRIRTENGALGRTAKDGCQRD